MVLAANLTRTAAGVRLSWRTSSEVGVLGFNVWRSGAKLGAALIRARALAGSATYRFLDGTARRGRKYRYRLETVYQDGRSTFTVFRTG